jgi:phage terminase large subunit
MNLNVNHKDFFKSQTELLLFYGGAGSGKSYSVADKIILNCLVHAKSNKHIKVMIIRKSYPSLRRTCWELIAQRLEYHKIPYQMNKVDSTIKITGCTLYFLSMNNSSEYEKVKSMTDITMIWIEEANEISLQAFEVVNLRLRGGRDLYKQMILTFNPISINNWIYDIFFVKNKYSSEKMKVNYKSNPYIDDNYKQKLEDLKLANEQLYNVYCLGEWGQLQEVIYNNYQIEWFDRIGGDRFYGLDFGYNNPSALVEITCRDDVYYCRELLYRSKLTNNDLIEIMKGLNISGVVYCDSAEPDRINELGRAGFNARSSNKSVKDGIDYVQSKKLVIHPDSENLIKELQTYSWKKIDDKILDEPVKFNDHCLDALRMGMFTNRDQSTDYEVQIEDISSNFRF